MGQAKYLKASPVLFEALGHRRRETLRPDKSASLGEPAREAGLKAGDVMVSIDGEKVSDLMSTVNRMSNLTTGKDIPFVVRRAGQERTIVVKGEY